MTRTRPRYRWTDLLASAIALPAALSFAQDAVPTSNPADALDTPLPLTQCADDADLLKMEVPVVVTAARREQPIALVPYAISVITAEDIRRSGARSIPDALRLVPGVDVADLGYGNAAVSPRGFHGFLARQVLVLVDGRQIFDSFFGGTVWGSWPISLEDIERIEVIRGPAGVTWGANAVNGVINIITKDPADQTGVTVSGGGGTQATHREYVGGGLADERLHVRVSGEYEGSDGFYHGGLALMRPDDDYRAARGSMMLKYAPSDSDTFMLSGGSSVVGSGFPRSPLSGIGGARQDESQGSFLLARWDRKLEREGSLEWTIYANDSFVSPGLRAVDYRYQQYAFQVSHRFKPSAAHTFTWGLDARADTFDGTNADPFMSTRDYVSGGILGLYAEDEWTFAPRWTLNLGARVDYDTYGGFQPSGRAALGYQFSEHSSAYAAVARAFQMPPIGIRFVDTPFLDGIARATSRQDVEAESLIAYELGYRTRLFERLDVRANLFWHEFEDITTLSPRLGPPGLINLLEDNRASAGMYGAELESRFRILPELTLDAHYTYQELGWDSSARIQEKDMMSPPRHKFMIGPRWSPRDDLHFSAQAYWVDAVAAPNPWNPFLSQAIPPYWRLDLRAEYEFWERRAAVAVGVRNLLDDYHPEGATQFLNNVEVPRMVYAELRIRFK